MYIVTTNTGACMTSANRFFGPAKARNHFQDMIDEDHDAVQIYEVPKSPLDEALDLITRRDSKCVLLHKRESEYYRHQRLFRDLKLDLSDLDL
jgi:hypothetical protein